MEKKRILFCGEATYLSTGFGIYGYEVMTRLHATGKYELAEFASYGGTEVNSENRHTNIPWKYYPNLPQNAEESQIYKSKPTNQWGEWKFEHVLLDFKPDIVFDIRDWWMFEYQQRSPLRQYFNWVIMPTVDSAPQEDQWMATYQDADAVFTYSDWALDLLRASGVATQATASPGVDFKNYVVPADKRKHKEAMGLSPDSLIIGTVMRNQKRKLYPDLIESFATFLKQAPPELADKTYLYLHCAYPDIAWNIPKLIKSAGIANKTIFTYTCQECQSSFPSFYQDVVGYCHKCGSYKAVLPRSQQGVTTNVLGKIMGIFDVYVQYATCEGFGMPQAEAAACGVPIFAVDYSAMSDVVRKLKGYPINVARYFMESETHTYKALPDNQDFVNKLISFLSLPETMRLKKGFESRKNCEAYYNWDRTTKIWENYFDKVIIRPHNETWNSPAKLFAPQQEIPQGLTNEEFVDWCFANILGRPDLTNTFLSAKILRDLNWGVCATGMDGGYFNDLSALGVQNNFQEFTRKEVLNLFLNLNQAYNFWERKRANIGD